MSPSVNSGAEISSVTFLNSASVATFSVMELTLSFVNLSIVMRTLLIGLSIAGDVMAATEALPFLPHLIYFQLFHLFVLKFSMVHESVPIVATQVFVYAAISLPAVP